MISNQKLVSIKFVYVFWTCNFENIKFSWWHSKLPRKYIITWGE
jgi:hypothetical protein